MPDPNARRLRRDATDTERAMGGPRDRVWPVIGFFAAPNSSNSSSISRARITPHRPKPTARNMRTVRQISADRSSWSKVGASSVLGQRVLTNTESVIEVI